MSEQLERNNIAIRHLLEGFENSEVYRILSGKIQGEIDSLKYAYKVKGDEAAELKGKYDGLSFFFTIIAALKADGDVAQTHQEKRRERIIEDDNPNEPKDI